MDQMQEQWIVGNKWIKITSFANHNNAHKVRLSPIVKSEKQSEVLKTSIQRVAEIKESKNIHIIIYKM